MALALRNPSNGITVRRSAPLSTRGRVTRPVICKSSTHESDAQTSIALPLVSMVAAAMIAGAVVPDLALAARSGGRAGRSSFAAKSSGRSRTYSAPRTSTTNVVVTPPVVAAPPLFSPFGGFGFSFFPSFYMPFPFVGGLFQFMFIILMVSVVFNVVSSATGSKAKGKDDGWGDL